MEELPQKSNRGGKRVGAGRKPKVLPDNLKQIIDNSVDFEKAMKELNELLFMPKTSTANKVKIVEMMMSYRYGKPNTTATIEATINTQINPKLISEFWELAETINIEDIE